MPRASKALRSLPWARPRARCWFTQLVSQFSGSYVMAADNALRVRVEFGALMWQKAERGAPGIGTSLNVIV